MFFTLYNILSSNFQNQNRYLLIYLQERQDYRMIYCLAACSIIDNKGLKM
jgi:hypothetical protein